MNLSKRIASFVEIGPRLRNYTTDPVLSEAVQKAGEENPWFTGDFVRYALEAWSDLLDPRLLTAWLASLSGLPEGPPLTVGVVMAGNIPMVGFHDMACILLSGNRLKAKLSSQDRRLLPAIGRMLAASDPGWEERMSFTGERLEGFDAMIATGSNNTSRYFEYYFGKVPNIIRKNRNSAAVLTGDETDEELRDLAADVFLYFGMGCRSVSKLYLPCDYDPERLREPFSRFAGLSSHHKYMNNYMYQRTVMLINSTPFHDFGHCLLVPSGSLASPVSLIHYEFYERMEEVNRRLDESAGQLQCVVGIDGVPGANVRPGEAQRPAWTEYADGIDTLSFLTEKIRHTDIAG